MFKRCDNVLQPGVCRKSIKICTEDQADMWVSPDPNKKSPSNLLKHLQAKKYMLRNVIIAKRDFALSTIFFTNALRSTVHNDLNNGSLAFTSGIRHQFLTI